MAFSPAWGGTIPYGTTVFAPDVKDEVMRNRRHRANVAARRRELNMAASFVFRRSLIGLFLQTQLAIDFVSDLRERIETVDRTVTEEEVADETVREVEEFLKRQRESQEAASKGRRREYRGYLDWRRLPAEMAGQFPEQLIQYWLRSPKKLDDPPTDPDEDDEDRRKQIHEWFERRRWNKYTRRFEMAFGGFQRQRFGARRRRPAYGRTFRPYRRGYRPYYPRYRRSYRRRWY